MAEHSGVLTPELIPADLFDLDRLTRQMRRVRGAILDERGGLVSSRPIPAAFEFTPPPAGDLLTWAPPVAGSGGVAVVNYTLTNSNRTSIPLGAGRDLVIDNTQVLTGPLNELRGWRHIIWIGGEFLSSVGGAAGHIIPRENTGTVHLEGIKFVPTVAGSDFIGVRADTAGITSPLLQMQNIYARISGSSPHADGLQAQFARLAALRVDKVTMFTDYQGFFIFNEPGYTNPTFFGTIDMRRTNFRPLVAGVSPAGSFMFKGFSGSDAFYNNLGAWTLTDVWMTNVGTPANNVVPNVNFNNYVAGGTHRYGCFLRTDAQGTYVAFSTPADTVPVGSFAGQACFDSEIAGKLRVGEPPGGDFCPVDTPGLSYVSPGYIS